MNFTNIFLLTGGLQAIILLMFFFVTKEKRTTNRLLAIMMLVCAVNCLVFGYTPLKSEKYYEYLVRFSFVISTTFFPSVYIYTKISLGKAKNFRNKDFKHYIPYFLFVFLGLPFFVIITSVWLKLTNWTYPEWTYNIVQISNAVLYWLLGFQGIFYSWKTYKLLNKIGKVDQSDQHSQSIQTWLNNLLLVSLLVLLVAAVKILTINGLGFGFLTPQTNYRLIPAMIMIYILTYKCISNPEIFKNKQLKVVSKPIAVMPIAEVINVERPILHIEEKEEVFSEEEKEKLKKYIETEKAYLNTKLGLQDLVDELGISRNRMSTLFQQTYKKKFYDVINNFRLDEAIRQLKEKENDHIKLEILAYQSGFHSKATFNKLFKEKMGQTPSAYRKEVRFSREKMA
ncbi:helix-turn-helix domain-containing protein [Sediminitomix flava]|uniref:Helix-turn-helix protein n=1 Tax=Sediminitomix flava TaxID=379075 RepID=A0A315Z7W3_SEDFL|nr:helix-turn-helix domain-containing protein [Sediminitomix flava]PWJ40947.1 helix-turn-helix protein [Sediminitomix flava]